MTILLVDGDWTALRTAAAAITRKNAAVTVILKSSIALVPIPALNMEEAAADFELSLSTEERIRRNQCR